MNPKCRGGTSTNLHLILKSLWFKYKRVQYYLLVVISLLDYSPHFCFVPFFVFVYIIVCVVVPLLFVLCFVFCVLCFVFCVCVISVV